MDRWTKGAIFILFLVVCSCSYQENEHVSSIKKISEAIDPSAVKVVSNPETVLAIGKGVSLSHSNLLEFQKYRLEPKQVKAIQAVLLNDAHYHFDSVKKCLFLPEIALVFRGQEGDVVVLISLNCQQVRFIHEGKSTTIDYTAKNPPLKTIQTILANEKEKVS